MERIVERWNDPNKIMGYRAKPVNAFSQPVTVRFPLVEEITVFWYYEVGWSGGMSSDKVTKLWLTYSPKPSQSAFPML